MREASYDLPRAANDNLDPEMERRVQLWRHHLRTPICPRAAPIPGPLNSASTLEKRKRVEVDRWKKPQVIPSRETNELARGVRLEVDRW